MRLLVVSLVVVIAWFAPDQARADVRCVQAFLAETAFDPGPVDGLWGRKTGDALTSAFAQLDREVEGGIGRNNTDAVCALFSGPEGSEIADLLALRIYPISLDIDGDDLLADPTAFDFSKVKVAEDANFGFCSFTIKRYLFSEDVTDDIATGTLSIDNGWVSVTTARWRTGGFAQPEQLVEQTNLALTTDGKLVGRMIYYERFIPEGEVFEPPIYVTLPARHEKGPTYPAGETFFHANGWSEGSIRLFCR